MERVPLVETNLLVLKQKVRVSNGYCLANLNLIRHQISITTITKMYRKTGGISHYYFFINAP